MQCWLLGSSPLVSSEPERELGLSHGIGTSFLAYGVVMVRYRSASRTMVYQKSQQALSMGGSTNCRWANRSRSLFTIITESQAEKWLHLRLLTRARQHKCSASSRYLANLVKSNASHQVPMSCYTRS